MNMLHKDLADKFDGTMVLLKVINLQPDAKKFSMLKTESFLKHHLIIHDCPCVSLRGCVCEILDIILIHDKRNKMWKVFCLFELGPLIVVRLWYVIFIEKFRERRETANITPLGFQKSSLEALGIITWVRQCYTNFQQFVTFRKRRSTIDSSPPSDLRFLTF